jgi:hypothetical protein
MCESLIGRRQIMGERLAESAASPVRPCFTVAQSDGGDWIARDRRAGIERHFATQRAALHFVLFEFSGGGAAALLAPHP